MRKCAFRAWDPLHGGHSFLPDLDLRSIPDAQFGDGTTARRGVPTALATDQRFDRVSGFGEHSCGETTANRAYCWGFNRYGGLGDGTTTRRLRPVAVTGGLTFTQVSAGGTHSCGVTGTGALYCWGGNYTGQLGMGRWRIGRCLPL